MLFAFLHFYDVHPRSFTAYHHSTVREHMPKSHQAHLEWTPSRLIHWGESVGEATAQVIRTILDSKPHPEMGYRACLGIHSLAKAYSHPRLEAACQRALKTGLFLSQPEVDPETRPGRTSNPGARNRNAPARSMKISAAVTTTSPPPSSCNKTPI